MIDDVYINSLLAASAYADWAGNPSDIKAELINYRGFTEEQYQWFIGRFTHIGYAEDPNGFSATIFLDSETGQKTIAFRGTEPEFPWVDFITDISAFS